MIFKEVQRTRLSKAMLDMKNMCIYFISSLKQSYGHNHGQNLIIKKCRLSNWVMVF